VNGHIPQAVKSLSLQPVGRLSSTNRLHLAIGLPLRNTAALHALLQQIYDPASSQYRHYLTPEQFAEMFGPAKEDYVAVTDFAKANGLQVTVTFPNRVVLDVEGTVADIEKALHVRMRVYNHPTEARTFYAPDTEPSLDLPVPVLHIGGLDNYALPHPNLKEKPASKTTSATPNSGSGSSGSYRGSDFRAAYVPGTSLTGTGQSVGLLEFDGYYTNDITAYESQAGLPNVALMNVAVDGGIGKPGNGNSEVALDIEMVISMAPGISNVIVYEAPNSSPWEDLLNRMATDNLSKQLSCSWGGGGPDPTAEQAFIQMATQGQSFFNATGDSDAFTGAIPFPSDSTNITQVGGTTLTTTGPAGSYVSETVWNRGNSVGSSGGISTYYSIPPWQQGIDMTANQGSTTMRNVPDVALTAENVFVDYNNGGSGIFGGTSCAAPLWASFTALINQQAVAHGLPTVGFLNPDIYSIGKGSNYTASFHDITVGNNTSHHSRNMFFAVTGYDLCTGWGTPTGTNLINALAPQTQPTQPQLTTQPPSITFGLVASGQSTNRQFQVINTGGQPLTGTATANNAGSPFTVTAGSPFSLSPGQTGLVTVTFSPITAGAFANAINFTSNGGGSTNAVTGTSAVPPSAGFSGNPTSGLAPLAVTFTNTSSGTITNCFWNFGDGVTSNTLAATVSHTYNVTGTDTVALVASGPLGVNTNIQPNYITVTNIVPQADLALTKSSEPNPVPVGQPLTYTLTVTNGGFADAQSVTITDTLPTSVTFISATPSQGACTNINGTVVCNLSTLPNSSNTVVTIIVTPQLVGTIINTAVVTSTTSDPNLTNNTATASTTVIAVADLAIAKTGSPNPVLTSQSLTYTLTITNIGPFTATGVTVTDAVPVGVTVVSATPSQGTCTNISGIVICDLGSLASNGVATVTIVGAPTATVSIANITNTATVEANEFDPFTANNTASAATTVWLDSIGDGIPDWWRQQFFGSGATTNSDSCATCDPDGDGFNNLQEFLAGTDPTDPNSALRITSIVSTGADIVVSFTSSANKLYDLQFNDDLTITNWNAVVANISGNGTIASATDLGAASLTNRFYRVRLVP